MDFSDFVIPLPDKPNLVIGVIAGWGTRLDDAQWLLSEVMKKTPDLLIHLGDIYYAGTPDEDRDNFLDLINKLAAGIPTFTMAGTASAKVSQVGRWLTIQTYFQCFGRTSAISRFGCGATSISQFLTSEFRLFVISGSRSASVRLN